MWPSGKEEKGHGPGALGAGVLESKLKLFSVALTTPGPSQTVLP